MATSRTMLGQAINSGDFVRVKELLMDSDMATFKDRKGNTYIHYTCTMYRPYMIYLLAESGIDLNAQNKHGNTALHVTALQNECCNVGDLMAVGIDPFIKNNDGKTAQELSAQNKFWNTSYNLYYPGIFEAVRLHDIEKLKHLLHCWCKIYTERNGQNLRQYAASLKFHDIVAILDEHRHTISAIYGVLEYDLEKAKKALPSAKCDINFLNLASRKEHIVQHAIRQGHVAMVKLLVHFGANVNMSVMVNQFIRGPIFFEAISEKIDSRITHSVLSAHADLTLKDERGRTPLIYALDKSNGKVPASIVDFMLNYGTPFTERDITGLTARDVARFARRKDVVKLIDQRFIAMVRDSKLDSLKQIVMDAYDSIMINYNYRDTYIYASGNESTKTWDFIYSLKKFNEAITMLHAAIAVGDVASLEKILTERETEWETKMCLTPDECVSMLINTKDKGGRTAIMLSVLHEQMKCFKFFLQENYISSVDFNRKDNCLRTVYHYACAVPNCDTWIELLTATNVDINARDVKNRTAAEYVKHDDTRGWIQRERTRSYGLLTELTAIEKYEELRTIIKHKGDRSMDEFIRATKHFTLPLSSFTKLLSPLVPEYRDLLFLAIDYGKDTIAVRLADIGCDCVRKEKYDYTMWTDDDGQKETWYDAPSRAELLGRSELARYLRKKQSRQVRMAVEQTLKAARVDCMPIDKILIA